jgi:hypothetical protein
LLKKNIKNIKKFKPLLKYRNICIEITLIFGAIKKQLANYVKQLAEVSKRTIFSVYLEEFSVTYQKMYLKKIKKTSKHTPQIKLSSCNIAEIGGYVLIVINKIRKFSNLTTICLFLHKKNIKTTLKFF